MAHKGGVRASCTYNSVQHFAFQTVAFVEAGSPECGGWEGGLGGECGGDGGGGGVGR